MVINFDCGRGAKKSGHLDYPFKSYGPKFVSMHKTCGEVGVKKKSHGHNFVSSWGFSFQLIFLNLIKHYLFEYFRHTGLVKN